MPYSLTVKKREAKGKKIKALRDQKVVPGIIYGPERKENVPIEIGEQILNKAYDEAGESSLIDLTIEGEKEPVEALIKEVNFDPVTDKPLHVDFYQIKRGQKIETEVDIEFTGEAPIAKENGGIVNKNMDSIAIRCLPRDLEKVADLKIDLGKLKSLEDIIYVKDLELPEEIELLTDPEEVLVSVTEPREEEEEEAPALEEEMEKVEVEGEAEAEGEKPEGEAPREEGKGEEKGEEKKE